MSSGDLSKCPACGAITTGNPCGNCGARKYVPVRLGSGPGRVVLDYGGIEVELRSGNGSRLWSVSARAGERVAAREFDPQPGCAAGAIREAVREVANGR